MRLFGLEITRAKAAVPTDLQSVYDRGRWWSSLVREPFTGAWQRNKEERRESIAAHNAVYSCITLIASDVGKLPVCLKQQDANDIWTEVASPSFSPVLRKPNRYQNRIKFYEQWVVSKLINGNTYVLKERDDRKIVVALYILDPFRTKALVAADGSVYYQLSRDNLTGINEQVTVPASEIIHDTMVPLFHPLCGISPLTACGLAASQSLSIQRNSTAFFENGSQPSGILTAPGDIADEDAARLKKYWEEKFSGQNAGKVAVVGSDLKYTSMTMSAVDSQLIEQLKWSAETVCSCFHVPAYMIGVGQPPSYNNIEALNQQYYTQCLQGLIECIELCLDEGLGLVDVPGKTYGTEFDLDSLLRMDTATKVKTATDGIRGGLLMPDEARKKFDLKPVKGGNQVYLQQQNFSLEALAKRDAQDDPFASSKAPSASPGGAPAANDNATEEDLAAARQYYRWRQKTNTADLMQDIHVLTTRAS